MLTHLELKYKFNPSSDKVWRVVEAQHLSYTMRIARSLVGQSILEQIVDEVKPKLPEGAEKLHFLLSAPFKYDPGNFSRFARPGLGCGVFYGAINIDTAIYEIAFHRVRFLNAAVDIVLPENLVAHTAFQAIYSSEKEVDLGHLEPAQKAMLFNYSDYGACWDLADQLRLQGVQSILYPSIRDVKTRPCIAVMAWQCFSRSTIDTKLQQTWHFVVGSDSFMALCEMPKRTIKIPIKHFLRDPVLGGGLFDRLGQTRPPVATQG